MKQSRGGMMQFGCWLCDDIGTTTISSYIILHYLSLLAHVLHTAPKYTAFRSALSHSRLLQNPSTTCSFIFPFSIHKCAMFTARWARADGAISELPSLPTSYIEELQYLWLTSTSGHNEASTTNQALNVEMRSASDRKSRHKSIDHPRPTLHAQCSVHDSSSLLRQPFFKSIRNYFRNCRRCRGDTGRMWRHRPTERLWCHDCVQPSAHVIFISNNLETVNDVR